jgi:hypothetical protein
VNVCYDEDLRELRKLRGDGDVVDTGVDAGDELISGSIASKYQGLGPGTMIGALNSQSQGLLVIRSGCVVELAPKDILHARTFAASNWLRSAARQKPSEGQRTAENGVSRIGPLGHL